jgi:hypothetical protein
MLADTFDRIEDDVYLNWRNYSLDEKNPDKAVADGVRRI